MKIHNPFRAIKIGKHQDVYMFRWMLLPKNEYFNVYLHKFLRDDNIHYGLHDHPWNFLTIVLRYGYHELLQDRPPRVLLPFNVVYRKAEYIHAVRLRRGIDGKIKEAWTLNFTFKRRRQWGFWKDEEFTPATFYYNDKEESINVSNIPGRT